MTSLEKEQEYKKQLQEEFRDEPHVKDIIPIAARLYAMDPFYDKADITSFFPDALESVEDAFFFYQEDRFRGEHQGNDPDKDSGSEDADLQERYHKENEKAQWEDFVQSGRLYEAVFQDINYWSSFYTDQD